MLWSRSRFSSSAPSTPLDLRLRRCCRSRFRRTRFWFERAAVLRQSRHTAPHFGQLHVIEQAAEKQLQWREVSLQAAARDSGDRGHCPGELGRGAMREAFTHSFWPTCIILIILIARNERRRSSKAVQTSLERRQEATFAFPQKRVRALESCRATNMWSQSGEGHKTRETMVKRKQTVHSRRITSWPALCSEIHLAEHHTRRHSTGSQRANAHSQGIA